MLELINRLFPKDEGERRSSKFVERGLEALRLVRDNHAVAMGQIWRTPSSFELRVSAGHYESLAGMDALHDMSFFFKDELMKDLADKGMRTFGDHTIRVKIAADPVLGSNELYAVVLNPESPSVRAGEAGRGNTSQTPPGPDATRVLEDEPEQPVSNADATMVLPEDEPAVSPVPVGWTLMMRFPDGRTHSEHLDSEKWVLGRRGSTGEVRQGYQKLELDVPLTVSREQLLLELDGDTFLLRRIGKADVGLESGDLLGENESRRLGMDEPFFLEDIECRISPKI